MGLVMRSISHFRLALLQIRFCLGTFGVQTGQTTNSRCSGTTPVSTFKDGNSWSLGVGRKLSDSLSVSASYFSDPGDGNGVSELAPTGGTSSVSLGARYSLSDAATLSLGATMSQKGDATTSTLGAKTSGIRVNIVGAKISIKF